MLVAATAAYSQVSFEDNLSSLADTPISYGSIATFHGPGISFADYDNDGWDDISIPASDNRDFQFLRNTGGQFVLTSLPISSGGFHARQVSWVDFDNDGDNDFFALGETGNRWFYRNDGNNQFTDILGSSGLALQQWEYWGVCWGDYNNDGQLDALLLVRDPEQIHYNLLYRNNGDGSFTDVTAESGLMQTGQFTQAGAFLDYDKDGYQDIFVANDKDVIPNTLYKNLGNGSFQDVTIASGMDLEMDGMSATIDDFNRDGWLDIYITNIYPPVFSGSVIGNAFMRNNGDGTFSNIAFQNGTRFDSFGWGASFLDSELDGDLDLYVSSQLDGSDGRTPSAYYNNDGSGSFNIPTNAGFADDIYASYGNAIGDIQNDGLPDIAVVNIDNQPINLWENRSGNAGNWLKIKLQGTTSNRMGIGSYIKVKADGKRYYGYTLCGEGYISQNSQTEFFGIGDAQEIEYVEVTWLSGQTDRIENIAPNQLITLVEGSFPADPIDDEEDEPEDNDGVEDHSVARLWNDVLLDAIRVDLARPTVHARNLFHSTLAMYDAWAVFNEESETVFLGKSFGGYACNFEGIQEPEDPEEASEEVMSYALYRLLSHRFQDSPGVTFSQSNFNSLFLILGYDVDFTSTDYSNGSYAALGNYLGEQLISFGMQDGANEADAYSNKYYETVNEPLILSEYTDDVQLNDPSRWQPLSFDNFVDQSGNPIPGETPEFLSPEWGEVIPFANKTEDLIVLNNGFDSYIYQDPGAPPEIEDYNGINDPYKWNFALVAAWSAHLDPNDNTLIDISPGALGNVDLSAFPTSFQDYTNFYNFSEGGDIGTGHAVNPATGQAYEPQLVKRADYARVLAEFWADGPDSETPPGHWFTILNYVSDHPETIKKIGGEGEDLSDLEWDVKSYLALGGAMHDAAVSAWGVKGYYDYIRPISAIRYMASKGQSSDPLAASYHPHGMPLIPGLIELIEPGDPLAGVSNQNVGKIKIYAWKGPDFITDPTLETAGVDWILGTQWWPYQRPTFVTPPFAGYVSGHSTFSRAAAEVLTLLTGDPFFPGGMGVFDIEQNNFLVFEQGPSENMTLQWGTYRDASDQTSLSRIWGGIHPPVDDIPGRIMGDEIGKEAFGLAKDYFEGLAVLRPDNFVIQINGESCVDRNDGSIVIKASDYYNYVLSVEGEDREFTTNISVGNLAPGNYDVCIRIKNQPAILQCYKLTVAEVEALDVNASLEVFDSSSVVNLEINKGTAPFIVEVNGKIAGEYSNRNIQLFVGNGDDIQVSSSKPCEGIYFKNIVLPSFISAYPNPSASEISLIWPGETGMVEATVFNLSGQLVLQEKLDLSAGEVILPIQELANGVYILRLKGRVTRTVKIIKDSSD